MSKLTKFSDLKKIPCESSWFEPYKVAEGVTAIYEPHHFQEVISYLIEGETSALLLRKKPCCWTPAWAWATSRPSWNF